MVTPLRIPQRLLLGPGPSPVAPEVLRAMATPLLGHLDPAFLLVMDEIQARLRAVFGTRNAATFPVSGTGASGMEAVLGNLLEAGDRIVVGAGGVFGLRIVEQARRLGAEVEAIEVPFGEAVPQAALRAALERAPAAAVALVHAETSTGVLQDLAGIGALCRDHGALFLLDCVTSLGGAPLALDDDGVDAAYSCSQKCLGAPPGLSPVSFSPRALEKFARRRTKPVSWPLDLGLLLDYWGPARAYHHTAPISTLYALHEGLGLLLEEGLPASFARHRRVQEFLLRGLAELGLAPFTAAERRAPMLTAVSIPSGVDDLTVRRALYTRFGVEIGGGLGPLKGRIWRIGHMGYGAREEYMLTALGALRELLPR
jgi:alanine-glyoxylate transaminase/serine-glyoxylate transaminase/serine-pyruvate transaminase